MVFSTAGPRKMSSERYSAQAFEIMETIRSAFKPATFPYLPIWWYQQKKDTDEQIESTDHRDTEEIFDEYEPQEPSIRLFEINYLLTLNNNPDITMNTPYDQLVTPVQRNELYSEALMLIEANNISSFYEKIFTSNTTPAFDQAKFIAMNDAIAKKLVEFDETIAQHDESGSEQDIIDTEVERVKYLCKVCYSDASKLNVYLQTVLKKTSSSNTKIALHFALAKYLLSMCKFSQYSATIELLSPLVTKDGDWDARNRFNTYKGLNYLFQQNFTAAAECFISSIQTYSSTDLVSLDSAMIFAALLSVIRSPRKDFIDKIVDSPEIIQSLLNAKVEAAFIQTIYKCQYKEFYLLLPTLYDNLLKSPYFGALASFYMKEARCVAYKQFLYSFQYVKIDAFAAKFGVSTDFIENDVSYLIANGRLNCKINFVENVIEIIKSNDKMTQFNNLVDSADKIVARVNRLTQQSKAL